MASLTWRHFIGAVLPRREGAAGVGVRGRAAIPVALAFCWTAGEPRQNCAMEITDRIKHQQVPPPSHDVSSLSGLAERGNAATACLSEAARFFQP